MECSAPPLHLQVTAYRPGDFRQKTEPSFGGGPSENLWLVVHTGIPILDVQWIEVHARPRIFESNPNQQALRPTIAGTEREVPHTVEDRASAIDFEGLNDV